jgi:biotin carboxylase
MKKLAILGASYLQVPLIKKANDMGLETHVFAWETGAVGKSLATVFYPISILEKDQILSKCKEIEIDGVVSIASDVAMPTVNYVANQLVLVGNSLESTLISTDKYEMRKALSLKGIPCPGFVFKDSPSFNNVESLKFPLIVKPADRSGSRGVTKVNTIAQTNEAIVKALSNSIGKRVIVEEFIACDNEFSVEFISFKGKHFPLAITEKVTTKDPYFVELEHHQPALLDESTVRLIYSTVEKVLDALGIENGASHTELFLLTDGSVRIIESAGRMGGDLIGSHLVQLSTGFDFVKSVIDVALNRFEFNYKEQPTNPYSGVYYITPTPGVIIEIQNQSDQFEEVIHSEVLLNIGENVNPVLDGSGNRAGVIVYSSSSPRPIQDSSCVLNFITES